MHSQKQIIIIIFGKSVSPDKKRVLTFLFPYFTPAHSFPFILPPLFFFLFYSSPLDCSLSSSFSLLNREKSCLLWLKVEMIPLKFIKIYHPPTQSFIRSPRLPVTHSLIHSLTLSLTHSRTHPLTHPPAHAPTCSRTHTLTHSLYQSLNQSLIHSLSHLPTRLVTH